MRKIITILSVTFKEMIRQPAYSIILYLSALMIYISPWFSMFTLLNSTKLVRDMGLASVLMASILIASFSASGLVFREIENKTALTILSKPIYRIQFLIGKYLGLLAGIFLAVLQLTIFLILTMRMGVPESLHVILDKSVIYGINGIFVSSIIVAALLNYFFRKTFTSSLVITLFSLLIIVFSILCFVDSQLHAQPFAQNMDLRLFKAGLLIFMGMSIITSIALLGSIRFNMVANLIFCLAVFFITMTSDYFFGRSAGGNILSHGLYLIVPNLQFFWVADAFLNNKTIPLNYMLLTVLYTVNCVVCILTLSWILFKDREIA